MSATPHTVAVAASPAALRVRPARSNDLPALHALIELYSDRGVLLPRSVENLREILPNFRVISESQRLIACAALDLYTTEVAEIRSLAVDPAWQGSGLGRRLVEALIEEARARELALVFAFTYATEFFARLGFAPIDRSLLPWKVWKDCAFCPKRECCDEVAVAVHLRPTAASLLPILPARTETRG